MHSTTVKTLYTICVKVDETLPWIELKGEYQTKKEAKEAAKKLLNNIKIKIVKTSMDKRKIPATAKIIS
ncbi:MAG: hypothetical protein QXI91_03150 [Candidatus Bathyarchaeia archaeon]